MADRSVVTDATPHTRLPRIPFPVVRARILVRMSAHEYQSGFFLFFTTDSHTQKSNMAPTKGDVLARAPSFLLIFIVIVSFINCLTLTYSSEQLILLRPAVEDTLVKPVFENLSDFDRGLFLNSEHSQSKRESWTRNRKRGRRAGLLVRSRRRFKRAPLPTIIVSNVHRLHNKVDELFARIDSFKDYSNCSVYCFSETWLKPSQPDSLVQPPGFTIFRQDRDHQATGKRQGGGVCFLVNDRWCIDVRIISQGCTADLEHLTIKCRPFYLPREFSSVTLTSAYIHPRADVDSALGALCDVISDCENRDPDTMSIVAGDFNQASLSTVLPNYKQQITCPTRGPNTLDHCYCPIKSAYKSVQRPPLGNSDHSTILLIPYYKQELRTSKPIKRAVTLWPESAIHQLQDCFQDTLWTVFKGEDLNEFTETVCDYIGFCTDVCLPTKVVTQYPNNKPWFSKQLRSKVVAKDNAYRLRDTDPDAYRKAKSDLKKAIR